MGLAVKVNRTRSVSRGEADFVSLVSLVVIPFFNHKGHKEHKRVVNEKRYISFWEKTYTASKNNLNPVC